MTANIDKNEISSKEYRVKLKSSNSLISLSQERKDSHGNPISKRYKSHKVSFIDQVDKKRPLSEIIIVESFKDLNKESKISYNPIGFQHGNGDGAWNCSLF
jgi:hypothetical protein